MRGLLNEEEIPSTPYQLFFGKRPLISRFRVFGCPTIVRRWVLHNKNNGKQTERGTRGIFLGLHMNQKGYLVYSPGSRQVIISDDVTFDESFSSAIATTWQQHKDSLALQPLHSYIPDVTTTIERTGTIEDIQPTTVEQGNADEEEDDTPSLCDNIDDDFDKYDDDDLPPASSNPPVEEETPMIVDSSASLRRSTRLHKPNPRYANVATTYRRMGQHMYRL